MYIKPFGVDRWLNIYETEVDYNLTSTSIMPFSLQELIQLTGEDEQKVKEDIFFQSGKVQPEQLTEIGHLLLGQVAGRQSVEEITVFDSTGIALQDLAVTKQILDTAAEKNIGQVVEL